jgi:hypothetical protein
MRCDVIKATGLAFRCCESCHEDYEIYNSTYACEIEMNGWTILVCCACARALEGEPEYCPSSVAQGNRDDHGMYMDLSLI